MDGNIASRLGGFLAHFEQDMMEDGCDRDTLEMIHTISEVYRNFTETELGAFRSEFERGYSHAKSTLHKAFEPNAVNTDTPGCDKS